MAGYFGIDLGNILTLTTTERLPKLRTCQFKKRDKKKDACKITRDVRRDATGQGEFAGNELVLLSTEAMMRLDCVLLCSMLLMKRLPVEEVSKECVVTMMKKVKMQLEGGNREVLKEKKSSLGPCPTCVFSHLHQI